MFCLTSNSLQVLTNTVPWKRITIPWERIVDPSTAPHGSSSGLLVWIWKTIRTIFAPLGKLIISGFTFAFGWIIWILFVQGPLLFLRGLLQTFRFLSGGFILQLIFGSSTTFRWNKLPYTFIGLGVVAGALVGIFFIINIIISMCKQHEQFINSFKKSLIGAVLSIPTILIIPVLFFIFAFIMEQVSKLLIDGGVFGKGAINITDVLYNVGAKSKSFEHDFSKDLVPFDYSLPDNLSNWNIFVETIVVVTSTIMILLISIAIFTKIMEIFFLFVISPLVISAWTIDNGARLIIWKNHTIAKFLAMAASIFGVYILAIVLGQIIKVIENFDTSWETKTALKVAAIIGCTTAMPSFGALASSFINERAEAAEGRSAIRNSLALGKAMLAGTTFAAGAIGAIGPAMIGKKGMYSIKRFLGRDPAKIGGKSKQTLSKKNSYNNAPSNEFNNVSDEVEEMIGLGGAAGAIVGSAKFGFHALKNIRHPIRHYKSRRENIKEYTSKRAEMMGKKVEDLGFWEKVALKRDANRIHKKQKWFGDQKLHDKAELEYRTIIAKRQEEEEKQKKIAEETRIENWLDKYGISKTTWQRADSIYKNKDLFKKQTGLDLSGRTQEEIAMALHRQEMKHVAKNMSDLEFENKDEVKK